MAEALYVAISTDTGCFRYSNVTAETFRCAAACMEAGAEVHPINRTFFEIKRKARLRLEAYLTEHMEFFADGKVAVSAIPNAVMDELDLTEDDVDDISGFGRSVEGVELAAMLREVDGGMGKLSLRSSAAFNAAAICARLGGGGHPAAAGASVPGGIPAIRSALLKVLADYVKL
jgi:phosphoesterase RecJ-like protein